MYYHLGCQVLVPGATSFQTHDTVRVVHPSGQLVMNLVFLWRHLLLVLDLVFFYLFIGGNT